MLWRRKVDWVEVGAGGGRLKALDGAMDWLLG